MCSANPVSSVAHVNTRQPVRPGGELKRAANRFAARPREGGDPDWIPAFAGMSGTSKIRSRDALRARALRITTRTKKTATPRREAERRQAHRPCPHHTIECCHSIAARQRLDREPLAFRRSAAALARANASAVGSAPVSAFPQTRSGGRYPLQSVCSLPSSSETGRDAGRAVTQSRPGTVCETARGHRTRSASRSHPECALR
jgi:hypothetical protein